MLLRDLLQPSKKTHPELSRLKKLLGFSPKKTEIYSIALRHSSASSQVRGKMDNQRLEFLGDAILGAVMAEYLYRKLPMKDEGYLTQMRSKIVSRKKLNSIAEKMGLLELIETRNHRPKTGQAMLGDALEALIGAIYIDRGYACAQRFVKMKLIDKHVQFNDLDKTVISFKGQLLEWKQKNKKKLELTVKNIGGGEGRPGFECLVHLDGDLVASARGRSKKRAEENACEKAFSKLQISL